MDAIEDCSISHRDSFVKPGPGIDRTNGASANALDTKDGLGLDTDMLLLAEDKLQCKFDSMRSCGCGRLAAGMGCETPVSDLQGREL